MRARADRSVIGKLFFRNGHTKRCVVRGQDDPWKRNKTELTVYRFPPPGRFYIPFWVKRAYTRDGKPLSGGGLFKSTAHGNRGDTIGAYLLRRFAVIRTD